MAGVKFFKTGQWDKVNATINATHLIKGIDAANELAMKNVVVTGERIVVKMLQSQTLSWAKLKDSTLKAKLNKKPPGSNKILIDSSTYLQSITSFTSNGNGFIGVRRIAAYKKGMAVANIAMIQEYGSRSRNIPARPLFHPARNLLMAWISKNKPFITEIGRFLK